MKKKVRIIRVTTIPLSLNIFCRGMLKELTNNYEVIAMSSPGEELDEIANREGVKVVALKMERRISILRDFSSLYFSYKSFREIKPVMVHSMTPKAGLICMLAAWLARVPVRVHTFTGLVFPTARGLSRKILMVTDWLTCSCATHIIPEGEGVKNDLLQNRITKKPLKVLGYGNVRGVDMEFCSRRLEVLERAKSLKKDVFTFLFVGRVVGDKGVNELCDAFNKLSAIKNVRLVLVGPSENNLDPISDNSSKIIEKNSSIETVGEKFGDELLAYYAAADCFILPSYREGFPNTVLEAGAMGLPCIVTDINGSREIIVEGKNGVIVPSKDADALFNAMMKMMSDETARERMGRNARQMIADKFEQGFVRKCLYDFYDEILAPYK